MMMILRPGIIPDALRSVEQDAFKDNEEIEEIADKVEEQRLRKMGVIAAQIWKQLTWSWTSSQRSLYETGGSGPGSWQRDIFISTDDEENG